MFIPTHVHACTHLYLDDSYSRYFGRNQIQATWGNEGWMNETVPLKLIFKLQMNKQESCSLP